MPEAGLAVAAAVKDPRPERDDVLMGRLIRRAQSGDLGAFEELYRLHYRMILGNHLRIVRHREDADDLTSLTFLAMYSKLASNFTLVATREQMHGLRFRRWLLAIARNLRRVYWTNGKTVPRLPGTGSSSGRYWHRLSDINDAARTGTCSICGENVPLRYRSDRNRFACRNTATGRTAAQRKKTAAKRAPKPFWPATNGRSVVSYPVSPDWVLRYAVDAVSDFNGAPEDSPVWAALDRAVRRRFVCR